MHFFHKRRFKKNVAAKYCLSFFIADSDLSLKSLVLDHDDVYFYYWYLNLKFIYSENDTLEAFSKENSALFTDVDFNTSNLYCKHFLIKMFEVFFECNIFNLFEKIVKFLSIKRVLSKNKELGNPFGVVISDSVMKFHVTDIRKSIREDYLAFFAK